MAQKPEIISLNDFVKIQQESFISQELWLTDGITEYLVAKRDLEKPYVSLVIDIDQENPVYGIKDNSVQFRFNGRFHIPVSDKEDQALELTSEQWVELLQQWFDENGVEVVIGEKAIDFIKFTAIMSVLELPEQSPEGEGDTPSEEGGSPEESSEDMGTEESTEPKAEPESGPETEESETTPETNEAEESPKETPDDDKELKEFEDALGL
jgi:hypothetical protein